MSDLTKGEIYQEAKEKIAPIANEIEVRKKKLIENAAVIISISLVVLSIILYAYNTGYCRVFDLPVTVMMVDIKQIIPLAIQILGIGVYILFYISSFKTDQVLKQNRINFVRIILGFVIISHFLSKNNISSVIGNWLSLAIECTIPLFLEIMIYFRNKPKKVRKVKESEHQSVLLNIIEESIFSIYYIKFGVCIITLPLIFAPLIGDFSAKAERDYQTCVVQDTTYAVIVDYSDKVLAQKAFEKGNTLQIDTNSYIYFDKTNVTFRYSEYESVNIGME